MGRHRRQIAATEQPLHGRDSHADRHAEDAPAVNNTGICWLVPSVRMVNLFISRVCASLQHSTEQGSDNHETRLASGKFFKDLHAK